MNFSKINELKPYDLNCNIFDVYSYDGLSMQELLCQFFTKINECIKTSNETIDLAEWLVNEGLKQEVAIKLTNWLNDGTLENVINVTLFENLNNKIDNVSSQLAHIEKKVNFIKVNVKELGAKGDGASDDSEYIKNAIELVSENGGGCIYFPCGEYVFNGVMFNGVNNNISNSFSTVNNITFEGETRGNTVIKLSNHVNSDMFLFRYCNNIKFSNITLNGNVSYNQNGNRAYWSGQSCLILTRDCKNITIENCGFINAQYFGVNISSDSQNLKFTNNFIDNCVSGIDVCGQYLNISNNYISNCSDVGLFLEGNTGYSLSESYTAINAFIDVINNKIIDCKYSLNVKNLFYSVNIENNNIDKCVYGITVDSSNLSFPSQNLNVKNNFTLSSSNNGILINNVQYANISSNTTAKCLNGIYLNKVSDSNIKDNNIYDNCNSGIQLQSSNTNLIISSNIIKNNNTNKTSTYNTSSGIFVNGNSSNISIYNNDINGKSNQEYGICLDSNPVYIYVYDNNICNNRTKDFLDKSGKSVLKLAGNILSDNKVTQSSIYNEINNYSILGYKRSLLSSIPTTGTWSVGDIIYNSRPSQGEFIGWVCIGGGTPGTWKGFGVIEN